MDHFYEQNQDCKAYSEAKRVYYTIGNTKYFINVFLFMKLYLNDRIFHECYEITQFAFTSQCKSVESFHCLLLINRSNLQCRILEFILFYSISNFEGEKSFFFLSYLVCFKQLKLGFLFIITQIPGHITACNYTVLTTQLSTDQLTPATLTIEEADCRLHYQTIPTLGNSPDNTDQSTPFLCLCTMLDQGLPCFGHFHKNNFSGKHIGSRKFSILR